MLYRVIQTKLLQEPVLAQCGGFSGDPSICIVFFSVSVSFKGRGLLVSVYFLKTLLTNILIKKTAPLLLSIFRSWKLDLRPLHGLVDGVSHQVPRE